MRRALCWKRAGNQAGGGSRTPSGSEAGESTTSACLSGQRTRRSCSRKGELVSVSEEGWQGVQEFCPPGPRGRVLDWLQTCRGSGHNVPVHLNLRGGEGRFLGSFVNKAVVSYLNATRPWAPCRFSIDSHLGPRVCEGGVGVRVYPGCAGCGLSTDWGDGASTWLFLGNVDCVKAVDS